MINKDSNIDEVLKAVKKNGRLLKNASDTFKDDDFVVMKAIKQNGSALQFASHRLKKIGISFYWLQDQTRYTTLYL